jgi:hypothetical protein
MDPKPEQPPKTPEEIERELWERLNAGAIKQSTIKVEAKAPKPRSNSVQLDEKSVPRTAAALRALIKTRHRDLWGTMLGAPTKPSKLKVHIFPAVLIGASCLHSQKVTLPKIPPYQKLTFAFLQAFAYLLVRQVVFQDRSANTSRYIIPKGPIHIVVPLEALGDIEILDRSASSGQLPVWESELIHELVHEHQHKLIQTASDEGRSLMAGDKTGFPGPGHDERFYTAICVCARRLNLDPGELRLMI